ncbi:HAMP domain-containing sensor histidine kinase [Fusobacterium sp.]|uniref:HAMP domain-containing sensor histidine kinase n=1 Tax=Fusobacterium sp. TaxID=68766 RepID=UPI002639BCF0|nr:HAMP domain-containing sensor histidine kinase [Fusobacterium sp.]
MKIKINFFRKIFILSIFIVFFTVVVGYILNIFFLDRFYIYRKKESMRIAAETTKTLISKKYKDEFEEYREDLKDKEGIDISIVRGKNHLRRKGEVGKIREGFNITNIARTNSKLLIYNETLPDNRNLVLRTSLSVMSAHKHEMNIFNLVTTIISVFISMILGRIFSKKITSNLEKLNKATKKISVLDFSEKIDIKSGDEIEELSNSINTMSKDLNSSIENIKSFSSNASHELRTPITVINTYAQALTNGVAKTEEERKKYYSAILKESNNMSDLVNNLLIISRLSSPGIKLNKEKINLLDLIKESIEKYEILELEKDIEWDIKIKNERLICDKKIFKIAMDNIIHNALKYSKDSEKIKIYSFENEICIENKIENKIKDVEKLWEPFARGENANELKIQGYGLGLALIKRIMDLNNIPCGIKLKDENFIFYFDILRS